MLETEMAPLSTPQLRYREALYFYTQFTAHCGPPQDSYFHMICYFDSFLYALASIEEMVDDNAKAQLRSSDAFRFIKALRNISAHHCVLASSQQDSKFVRPFARHLSNNVGGIETSSGKLAINYDRFLEIFDKVEAEVRREKYTLDAARTYLTLLKSKNQPVFLEDVLHDSLLAVHAVVA